MGCTNILKNAVGIIGIIVVIAICITPLIKIIVLILVYSLGAAVCQPIADKKIIKLMEQMKNTFKLLFGITASVSTMFIIGVTIIIKMSGIF